MEKNAAGVTAMAHKPKSAELSFCKFPRNPIYVNAVINVNTRLEALLPEQLVKKCLDNLKLVFLHLVGDQYNLSA